MLFGNINSGIGRTTQMLHMGLDASLLRRNLIANNIANVDTPGYKRAELSFESQLRRAVSSESPPLLEAYKTDDRHISFDEKLDFTAVQSRINVEYDSTYRNDGNGVDVDVEAADAAKNAMQYNLLMELYSRNIKLLDMAMK